MSWSNDVTDAMSGELGANQASKFLPPCWGHVRLGQWTMSTAGEVMVELSRRSPSRAPCQLSMLLLGVVEKQRWHAVWRRSWHLVGECLPMCLRTSHPPQRHRLRGQIAICRRPDITAKPRKKATWRAHQAQLDEHGTSGRCSASHGARSGLWVRQRRGMQIPAYPCLRPLIQRIGFDLQGNTFWEFKDALHALRNRRIAKYSRSTHYGDVQISRMCVIYQRPISC